MATAQLTNENTVKKVFSGRIPLENACSLFIFEKNSLVQHLMHELKYKGRVEISFYLGKWLGAILSQLPAYQHIDYVIPIPLHKRKLAKRGYNQVAGFGQEIAKALGTNYTHHVLIKNNPSKTQVFKDRFARAQLQHHLFALNGADLLKNKHILLVDDIITTGATLETCAKKLLDIPGLKISIASMALTI
ncbi:ComF family protein [uncultured Mesonia sp.]|uniref:ComF family protein n=1 Tax=uncultured Mesonia sp. TaxID=399731 RepID=UPI00374F6E41